MASRALAGDASLRKDHNGEGADFTMFKNVVVGIDGDRSDSDAVSAAQAIAPGASLHLVNVYPGGDGEPRRGLDEYRERLRGDALRLLEATRVAAGLPDAQVHAVPGQTASRSLKAFAREAGADLIVLGAVHRGFVDRVIIGDVARGVLHGAPCPVLNVARSGVAAASRPATIGVAYDASPESEVALEAAVDIAKGLGARLELVQAVDVGLDPRLWGPELAKYVTGLVGPVDERMRELAGSLPVDAAGSAVQAPAAQALHALSTRVDLMVCGSRSWGPAARVAFGSSADRLVHHAPCPVLVVPRGAVIPAGEDTIAEPAAAGQDRSAAAAG